MRKYLPTILFLIILGLIFFKVYNKNKDVNFGETKEIQDEKMGDISLYKKSVEGKYLYMTLDVSENKNFKDESLVKLHTNTFWDPKKCSQMQVVLGKEKIMFVDSFIESEGNPGFLAFIFVYNIKENTLVQYESPVSISKIYKTEEGDSFFIISKIKDGGNNYNLYKVDLDNKKFVFVKNYRQPDGYGLITSTKTLLWCANFGKDCVGDKYYPFQTKEDVLKVEKDVDNVFGVNVSWVNNTIFQLKSKDLVRSFILGVI